MKFKKKKKIVLIGHSHTNCIYSELLESFSSEYLVQRIHLVEVLNEMKEKELVGKVSLNSFLLDKINESVSFLSDEKSFFFKKESLKDINIILLLGGNFHHMLGLLKTDPPFDFVHPNYSELMIDDKAEVIPYGAVMGIFDAEINHYIETIKSIRRSFSCNILHLGFPPPLYDEKIIMDNIEVFFTSRYDNPKLAHHNLRFKLWRVFTDMFKAMCDRYDTPFIFVPKIVMENEMYLKEKGFKDTIHANSWYAKRYIESFESKLV